MKSFVSALTILQERLKFELGYISREIECNEKDHAFLLAKRHAVETSLKQLGIEIQWLKGSEQQSKQ